LTINRGSPLKFHDDSDILIPEDVTLILD